MAGEARGGTLLVEVIGDVDRQKLVGQINAAVKGVGATIPVDFKIQKGAANAVVAEAQADFDKRKVVPKIPVAFKLKRGAGGEIIAAAQTDFDKRAKIPKLPVAFKIKRGAATEMVKEANAQLNAAARTAPKIRVDLDLDVDELKAVKEARVKVQGMRAEMQATPLQIPVDLDPKALALVSQKAQEAFRVMQAKIDAQYAEHLKIREMLEAEAHAKARGRQLAQLELSDHIADAHEKKRNADLRARLSNIDGIVEEDARKHQTKLSQLLAAGLDKRSLEELKHINRVALLHERSELSKRRASNTTLRVLRNDLSQFDASTTRILRKIAFSFTLLNAGIVAGFAATATAAIVQFGRIEVAANKAASLFTAQALGGSGLTGNAFRDKLLSTNRDITEQITKTSRQVAVETKFNTQEVAEGFRFLAGAGVELNQSLASVPTVARLAQAGFLELEDTSDLLVQGFIAAGGDIRNFGKEVDGLSDKLVFVANESAVTLEEALKAFSNRAGASFVAVGQSADEALNVIRLFGQTGIKGLKAGEQSAILIREITRSATLKAPKAWKRLGIEIANADGSARSFATVLDELTTALAKRTNNFKKPGELVKILNKELQLTEKSSGGLRQLLPSIAKLQERGSGAAEALRQLREESTGRLAAQTQAVTDTLGFQFEAFTNNISNIASEFASSAGNAVKDFFKEINGGTGSGDSLFVKLEEEAQGFGASFGKVMRSALNDLRGVEGKEFFSGIVEGVRSTLSGVTGLFTEFRREVFGEGSDKGFFAVLGDAFEAFGNFSEKTLPRIGRALGIITSFVKENKPLVKAFVASWLGLFLASKALRLFIIPLVGLSTQLTAIRDVTRGIMELGFVRWIATTTAGMFGLTAATTAQAAATEALAAAQAQVVAGKGLGKAGKLAEGVAGPATAATAVESAAAVGTMTKLRGVVAGLSLDFAKLAKASVVIPLVLGIVKGAVDQLNEAMGGDGNISARDFVASLRAVAHALGAVIKPIVQAIFFIGKLLFQIGRLVGMILTFGLIKLIRGIGWVLNVGLVKPLIGAIKKIGEFVGWLGKMAMKLDFVRSAVEKFKGVLPSGDNQWFELSRENTALQNIGKSLTWIGEGWEKAGAQGIGEAFHGFSEEITHNNKKLDENIAKNMKINAAHRAAEAELQKRIAKERAAITVLGVTQDFAAARARALDIGNRGMAQGLLLAARSGSQAERRQRSLALVMDVLRGRVKDLSLRQTILAHATQSVGENMDRLAGKKRINTLLDQVAQGSKTATAELLKLNAAAIEAARALSLKQITEEAPGSLRIKMIADTNARFDAQRKKYIEFLKGLGAAGKAAGLQPDLPDIPGFMDSTEEGAKKAAAATKEVKTAVEQAADAVNKLSAAQFKALADRTISKILKMPEGYKATAREIAVLQASMPALDRAIQTQTDAITKLDEALQSLQSTQLLGTQANTDATFALDQQQKQLQLQRVNLQLGGAGEEDPAIKAIDDQLQSLQLQTEKLSLESSIALDPLKKKLEETFTPVKELSFDAIIAEFGKLTAQKEKLQSGLNKNETLKARLEAIASDATDKFAGVGLAVTQGVKSGVDAGRPAVVKGAKDMSAALVSATDKALGIASPSRVMAQRGLWVTEGFVIGINSGQDAVQHAGVTTMFGFLTGMRNVYENRVQPFVLQIAEWIKANKGPIAYDAQLLRPAGEAMMSGFHRGLSDGFGEIKGWVKRVGPQLATDTFPKELLIERSARFLLNNAKADATFTADDAFGDLVGGLLSGIGPLDPTLSFLHRTLSVADTENMARRLLALYPSMNLGALMNDHSKYVAGTHRLSDHSLGIAADLGTGTSHPTADSLSLFSKLKPLIGIIFKQLIHNGLGLSAGGGSFSDPNHYDHIHAAWLQGPGFSVNSGKMGVGGINIPGVPADVLMAINSAAQATGLPPALIAAVMKQESGFRSHVVSPDGGYGLMQLTSAGLVARARGRGSIFDPNVNALVGAEYLRDLINQLGSIKLGLSAYNSGPGGGERFGHIDVPSYVSSVMHIFEEYMRKFGGVGTFRRQGGRLNSGQASWVGEGGRELWVPDRSGTVISNKNVEDLIRMAKGGGKPGAAGGDYIDQRQYHAHSNSPDPRVVVDLMESRMRGQMTKVSR